MTIGRTIKVSVPITVEIDVDAWLDNYGYESDESVTAVRADVKRHAENIVRQQLADVGVLAR